MRLVHRMYGALVTPIANLGARSHTLFVWALTYPVRHAGCIRTKTVRTAPLPKIITCIQWVQMQTKKVRTQTQTVQTQTQTVRMQTQTVRT